MMAVILPRLSFGMETIDRVVAVVNGHVLLLSEWDSAARMEVLLDHRLLDSLSDASRRATLDRMIDQEVMRSEMENSSAPQCTPAEIAAKVREIREQYPEAKEDAAWQAMLQRYGVTSEELEAAVTLQLNGLRLLDFRLRSSAQPDLSQIERYYRDTYQPAMREKHAQAAPLADVTPQIREILTQQKLNDLTTTWLQELRDRADVRLNVNGEDGALPKPVTKPVTKP
jgi:hypothetical protein